MVYENKVAIVVNNDLKDWQKLNVVSFLASSIPIKFSETHGKEFVNKSNSVYLPFIKHPIMIYAADSTDEIKRAFKRAKERELAIGIYTEPLFSTKCEEENLIEISKYDDNNQLLVGMIVYGISKKVNKAFDGLKLHT